jgi:hypothetical protein
VAQRTLRLGVALTLIGAVAFAFAGVVDGAVIPLVLGVGLVALGARVARPDSLRSKAAIVLAGLGFVIALPGAAQLVALLAGGDLEASAGAVILRTLMAALCGAYVVAAAWFPRTEESSAL